MTNLSHSGKESIFTQEQLLEKGRVTQHFTIGIPKEDMLRETRTPLTPEGVAILVNNGHNLFIEEGSGDGAFFTDVEYSEAGAVITERAEVLQQDLILKITPPSDDDISSMKKGALLISMMCVNLLSKSNLEEMRKKSITAVAIDWIEDERGKRPMANLMREIEGNASIMVAASMSRHTRGKGVMIGSVAGVSPTEVVILGAGVAGITAAKSAIAMGATVKFFDESLPALQKVREVFGNSVFTSILHPNAIIKALKSADVLIGALQQRQNVPSFILSEELMATTKSGIIAIDLNMNASGSFEKSRLTTLKKPIHRYEGVQYYCLQSLATLYPKTAAIALSNGVVPHILEMDYNGGCEQHICSELNFQKGVYMYNGTLTNYEIGNQFGIVSKNLQLLLTAF
jgi:alanine dehydrogenase